jgi:hypothetical protein
MMQAATITLYTSYIFLQNRVYSDINLDMPQKNVYIKEKELAKFCNGFDLGQMKKKIKI